MRCSASIVQLCSSAPAGLNAYDLQGALLGGAPRSTAAHWSSHRGMSKLSLTLGAEGRRIFLAGHRIEGKLPSRRVEFVTPSTTSGGSVTMSRPGAISLGSRRLQLTDGRGVDVTKLRQSRVVETRLWLIPLVWPPPMMTGDASARVALLCCPLLAVGWLPTIASATENSCR